MRKILSFLLLIALLQAAKITIAPKINLEKTFFKNNFHPLGILKAKRRPGGKKFLDFYTKAVKTHILEQSWAREGRKESSGPSLWMGWQGRFYAGLSAASGPLFWQVLTGRNFVLLQVADGGGRFFNLQKDRRRIIFKADIKEGASSFLLRSDCIEGRCLLSLGWTFRQGPLGLSAYRQVLYPGYENFGRIEWADQYRADFYERKGVRLSYEAKDFYLGLEVKSLAGEGPLPEIQLKFARSFTWAAAELGLRTHRREELEAFYYLKLYSRIPWIDTGLRVYLSTRKGLWEEDFWFVPVWDYLELEKGMRWGWAVLDLSLRAFNLLRGEEKGLSGGVRFSF